MIAAIPEVRAIAVRPARPDDQAFVGATFAEQLGRGGHKNPNAIADRILDSDRVRVLVAVDEDDRGRILGWLAYVPMPRVRAVLFCYVRSKERLRGVARQLCDAAWSGRVGAAWPRGTSWVHAGLRGGSRGIVERFAPTAVALEELI